MSYHPRPFRGTAGRRVREDDEGHAWSSSATAPEQDEPAPIPQPRSQYQNDDQADNDERRYAEA